jgi:voltage-gated potassium channel
LTHWFVSLSISDASSYSGLDKSSFLDHLYFSVITFATVGYGDINPITRSAKIAVMCEVSFGVMYVIFYLSAIASSPILALHSPSPDSRISDSQSHI